MNTQTETIDTKAIEALRARCQGVLSRPGEEGWSRLSTRTRLGTPSLTSWR